MKNSLVILILILTLLQVRLFAQQKKDTLINNGVYQALYSYEIGQPRRVIYKLYKGGGKCNREKEKFNFKKDSIIKKPSADSDDYGNGYDKGHLCNAEDFAFDCIKEEKTFRYYNCCPQTVALNRGEWKINETKIRELSQKDSLVIVCGGVFLKSSKPIKQGSKLIVPKYCYKVVISLSTHKLIQCTLFDNNDQPKAKEISLFDLEGRLRFFFDRVLGFTIIN